jgi:hypothetical protein
VRLRHLGAEQDDVAVLVVRLGGGDCGGPQRRADRQVGTGEEVLA